MCLLLLLFLSILLDLWTSFITDKRVDDVCMDINIYLMPLIKLYPQINIIWFDYLKPDSWTTSAGAISQEICNPFAFLENIRQWNCCSSREKGRFLCTKNIIDMLMWHGGSTGIIVERTLRWRGVTCMDLWSTICKKTELGPREPHVQCFTRPN